MEKLIDDQNAPSAKSVTSTAVGASVQYVKEVPTEPTVATPAAAPEPKKPATKEPTKFTQPIPFAIIRKTLVPNPRAGQPPKEIKKPDLLPVLDLAELTHLSALVQSGVIDTPPGLSLEMQFLLTIAERVGLTVKSV